MSLRTNDSANKRKRQFPSERANIRMPFQENSLAATCAHLAMQHE
jgi:hypothetical protein